MNAQRDNLEAIISELAATQAREVELLLRMEALLGGSPADVPAHAARVFDRAREVFGQDAARFLTTPHWELHHQMPIRAAQEVEGARRVEELLARISYGMPV